MTRWLAAARQAQQAGTQLTQPTKPQPNEVSSVMSVVSEGVRDKAAGFVPAHNAPATLATSATQRARVADLPAPQPRKHFSNEVSRLSGQALKDLQAATDVANILLEHLRGCDTREAVLAFLETYQTAIDALEAHAPVRKIHMHNLADYKVSDMKKGRK